MSKAFIFALGFGFGTGSTAGAAADGLAAGLAAGAGLAAAGDDDDDDDVVDSSSLRFVVFRFWGVSSTSSGASCPPRVPGCKPHWRGQLVSH